MSKLLVEFFLYCRSLSVVILEAAVDFAVQSRFFISDFALGYVPLGAMA